MRRFTKLPVLTVIVFLSVAVFVKADVQKKQDEAIFLQKAAETNESVSSVDQEMPLISDSPKNPLMREVTPTTKQQVTSIPTSVKNAESQSSSVRLDAVAPASGKFEQEITVRGSGFGTSSGQVWFYNSQSGLNLGGGPITSWSENEVKTKVPFVRGSNEYLIEVQTGSGAKSNRIAFKVTAGQPYFKTISPSGVKPGGEIIITGEEFGESAGSINFYKPENISSASGGSVIYAWSDTEIRANVPGILVPNQEYGVQIVTADGRQSSFKYYQVGN